MSLDPNASKAARSNRSRKGGVLRPEADAAEATGLTMMAHLDLLRD